MRHDGHDLACEVAGAVVPHVEVFGQAERSGTGQEPMRAAIGLVCAGFRTTSSTNGVLPARP